MRRLVLILALSATPAAAQQEGDSLMERGLRLFMDGLMQEMEPALRDLEGIARNAAPLLEELQKELGETLSELDAYHPPEFLPNGDILIRRKEPLDPDLPMPEPNADGSIDL
ncbi:hypothetical protein [Jannaschia ovalis]|uniref:AAA+ family ATPase n=1 Tax=Jannaschia ovalis TaxID=3038773 RepID=A0ABY8LDI9_9RHOB|nr:hypothetical protein [Jannaschia sp. GRR-S6-38]WGH79388.1 hypothetical protein P8627_03730 [Jannaschia sp. GRR-S6-38]